MFFKQFSLIVGLGATIADFGTKAKVTVSSGQGHKPK